MENVEMLDLDNAPKSIKVLVALKLAEASEQATSEAYRSMENSRDLMQKSVEIMDSIGGFDTPDGPEARASAIDIIDSCNRCLTFIEEAFDGFVESEHEA